MVIGRLLPTEPAPPAFAGEPPALIEEERARFDDSRTCRSRAVPLNHNHDAARCPSSRSPGSHPFSLRDILALSRRKTFGPYLTRNALSLPPPNSRLNTNVFATAPSSSAKLLPPSSRRPLMLNPTMSLQIQSTQDVSHLHATYFARSTPSIGLVSGPVVY